MLNIEFIERKVSSDKKSVFLTFKYTGPWASPAVEIQPFLEGEEQIPPYKGFFDVPTKTTSPIRLEVKGDAKAPLMNEEDAITFAGSSVPSVSTIREKAREDKEKNLKNEIEKLLSEAEDGMQPKLEKVTTKVEGDNLVITFTPPSQWTTTELGVRFISRKDGEASNPIIHGSIEAEKDGNKDTGNKILKISKDKFDSTSNEDSKYKLSFDRINHDFLVQIKGKEVSQPWATEINNYYLVRADVSLFNNKVPLVYSSDNPGVYGLQEPIIILYADVRAEYKDLPEFWPGKKEGDTNAEIKASMVLHELAMDTNKGTFDFVIEANIGYEIVKGLKLERAGFIYRKRAITKDQQEKVDAKRDELRKLKLEAFLEEAAARDKALNPSS